MCPKGVIFLNWDPLKALDMKRILAALLFLGFYGSFAQSFERYTVVLEPNPITVQVNQTLKPDLKVLMQNGEEVPLDSLTIVYQPLESPTVLRYEGLVPSSGAGIDTLGNITGGVPGTYNAPIVAYGSSGMGYSMLQIEVLNAPVAGIEVVEVADVMYAGTIVPLNLKITDEAGFEVENPNITISSADESVALVDGLGNLHLRSNGKTKINIDAGSISNSVDIEVVKNPVVEINFGPYDQEIRTGDVVPFQVTTLDNKGNQLTEVPITFSVNGTVSESGAGASAIIEKDGRFVAEQPGVYTVLASTGGKSAVATLRVVPRDVEGEIEIIGHGTINQSHTSDFWVWEGVDGRDYAVTGTWGADGKAYFWDVTSPGSPELIDSVQVDARTVNDVKVSEDGKVCIISREGASNRKNGIVILDVTNPRDVQIHTEYTESLTGGVHNLFIYQNHVYALSNGQKYEIINIEDPKNPVAVGKFEIESPSRAIHDVWIEDGIAYSSNWNDGVILVDVGNGVKGGSPSNPVEIGRYRSVGDANHAAFPFLSSSTGKRYVIAGDEIFPTVFLENPDAMFAPSGYLHFIDITDPDNPVEVARYEVPEAGSHNFWVEGETLYVGYYNGGVRVVDISGDLMGDLYKQGREIGYYKPFDADGYTPNAPFVWGAQPYKGHVFFSDYNSGLWAVKVTPRKPLETSIEAR